MIPSVLIILAWRSRRQVPARRPGLGAGRLSESDRFGVWESSGSATAGQAQQDKQENDPDKWHRWTVRIHGME
jgi:hypothetical protein